MQRADAIVIGGGPAGSTCAWKLRRAGMDVLVLDAREFPRTKLCAGWVTPEALDDLELTPDEYPRGLVTFHRLRLHWKALSVAPRTIQHSVRRYEFDDFLLRRSDATVVRHKAREIRRDADDFAVDDTFRAPYLIGAGGTACPVYRTLFQAKSPRNGALQTATYEHEFAYDWQDPDCHLWFFADRLPGYAWYVPKANGYLNVGLGGMATQLKQHNGHVRDYWRLFVERLHDKGLVRYEDYDPSGYSYYLRGTADTVRDGNAFIVGDAAGLATRDMCEGIGPAIRSGLLAARAITEGTDYCIDSIRPRSGNGWISRLLERSFTGEALLAREPAHCGAGRTEE